MLFRSTNLKGDQIGKRSYAVNQLSDTIKKLSVVPEIKLWIELFQNKTGLFAYRLNDEAIDANDPVAQMKNAFNQFSVEVPSLETLGLLPMDFVFSQRKYPEVFEI